MKILVVVILSFFIGSYANASPVSLNFTKVELNKFLDATYGEALHKNYVLSPDLIAQGKHVSLRVTVEQTALPTFLLSFLEQLGVDSRETGGVVYFSPKSILPSPLGGSSSIPLPAPVPSLVQPGTQLQQSVPTAVTRRELEVYTPVARTSEFICSFVVAMFNPGSCHATGPVVVLKLDQDDMDKLRPLLAQVDTVAGRVRINATFVEVTSTGRDGFGMSVLANILGAQVGVTVGSPSSASALTVKGSQFSAVIDAIKRDSRFKQIASPSGAVYSGERFSIVTGEDVPTLGDVQLDNKGNAAQAVVYRPSGVILDVTPRVVRGVPGTPLRVEAAIKAQVSSFVATTNGVNGSPTLSKREVQTVQLLDDGEIMVLGGLNSSKSTNTKSTLFGLPFGTADQADATELLLVLTASVDK